MAATQNGNLGLYSNYDIGESGWAAKMNSALDSLDALTQAVVKSATITTPPTSPSNGDAYIVPTGATGVWASNVGKIAVYYSRSSAWAYITPKAGWSVTAIDTGAKLGYTGSAWLTNTLYGSQFISPTGGAWPGPTGLGGARICGDASNAYGSYMVNGDYGPSQCIGYRVGGTPSAPTPISAAVGLFDIYCGSWDSTRWVYPANISFITEETFTASTHATQIRFATAPSGNSGATGLLRMVIEGGGTIRPGADNTQTNGSASYRWSTIYAGTAAINTSDAREKTQVSELSDAEKLVAQACKKLVRRYKMIDAVAAKGDAARWHFGVLAQDVIAAFAEQGLDATDYGLLCYDEWGATPAIEAEVDDVGNILTPATPGRDAGNRYGVRYDELLAFVISAI